MGDSLIEHVLAILGNKAKIQVDDASASEVHASRCSSEGELKLG